MQSPATQATESASAPTPPADAPPPSGDGAPATESPPAPPSSLVVEGEPLERLRAAAARAGLSVEKLLEQVASGTTGPKRDPVPFEPTNVDEMFRYARMLAGASLLPRAYYEREDREKRHPKIADVHFVLCKGQALGLHPTVSIATINIIDGKAEVGAQLMVGLCLKSGMCEYFEPVYEESDDRRATFATKRRGGRREVKFTYTIEMAERLGIAAKDNWRKQPDTMLRRRCQSMLAREVYPDIVMGLYDHDEIGEMRERERALGIDPDRVIQAEVGSVLDEVAHLAALPEPGEKLNLTAPTRMREAVPVRRDPMKERLTARAAERAASSDGAPTLGPGEVACRCGVPVLGPKGTLCTACAAS